MKYSITKELLEPKITNINISANVVECLKSRKGKEKGKKKKHIHGERKKRITVGCKMKM